MYVTLCPCQVMGLQQDSTAIGSHCNLHLAASYAGLQLTGKLLHCAKPLLCVLGSCSYVSLHPGSGPAIHYSCSICVVPQLIMPVLSPLGGWRQGSSPEGRGPAVILEAPQVWYHMRARQGRSLRPGHRAGASARSSVNNGLQPLSAGLPTLAPSTWHGGSSRKTDPDQCPLSPNQIRTATIHATPAATAQQQPAPPYIKVSSH